MKSIPMNVRLRGRRTWITMVGLLLVAAVPTVGIAVAADTPAYYVDSRDVDDRIIVRGGPVRLGPTVTAHSNTTHELVGIKNVSLVSKCRLKISLDWRKGEKVISVVVDEDETLARMGISAGASGGGTSAIIYLYKNGRQYCANSKTFHANANVWISITSIDPKKTPEAIVPAPEEPKPEDGNQKDAPTPSPTTPAPDPEPIAPIPPSEDPDFVE